MSCLNFYFLAKVLFPINTRRNIQDVEQDIKNMKLKNWNKLAHEKGNMAEELRRRLRPTDHLFGIVVRTSDCHPRGPGFDSRLYPRNFSGSIGSGTGSTQPCEDNWVAT